MERWHGRVALVTGASRGIGAGIARELVQHGMKVVGCARNDHKIEELRDELRNAGLAGEVIPFQCDLRNEEEILAMFDFVRKHYGGVDLCVNNAGIWYPSTLLEGATDHWSEMLTSISPANVYTDMSTSKGPPNYRFLDVSDVADALVYLLSAKPHTQVHDILIRSVEQAT